MSKKTFKIPKTVQDRNGIETLNILYSGCSRTVGIPEAERVCGGDDTRHG